MPSTPLILDKDHTLVRPKSGGTFIQHPEDQELIPGVAETLERYVRAGYWPVIASNQYGCTAINPATGQPYKTIQDTVREMQYVLRLLPQIHMALFCPNAGESCIKVRQSMSDKYFPVWGQILPDGVVKDFRKPGAGMLNYAVLCHAQYFGVDMKNPPALMVGDREEDRKAAANFRFMWANDWIGSHPEPITI